MSDTLELPRESLAAFCRKWKIQELAIFGSALRGELTPQSDVDFLYVFAPDASWSLLDLPDMECELGAIVGRKVDLVSRRAIERSKNWVLREHVLSSARTLYAA
jgi:uncharacterized protein